MQQQLPPSTWVYWYTHEQAAAALPVRVAGSEFVNPAFVAVTVMVADPLAASPVTVNVEVVLAIDPADVDIVYPAAAS